ncbi:hypothetical protein K7432_013095 [Basidiobolus ranarum]|uniref:NTF2-domain-containing protein n=1 Tax=Basidiobolus ranarum TaxID=34480 RepID=A0ABR2WJV4_9FUNG
MTATTNSADASNTPQKIESYEVGWMFVQEYYTFLNKDSSRLHCFYNKKSTMIHGTEGEQVKPYHGQQEIHSKILELGFDDCRVLVSSVDSQASLNGGIIIQVLGEMSNKGGPSQKFAQTFFLAEQPNGYFVLNDIFRYLKDEVDEEFDYETDITQDFSNNSLTESVQMEEPEVKQEIAPSVEDAKTSLPVEEVVPVPEEKVVSVQSEVADVPTKENLIEQDPVNGVSEQEHETIEPETPSTESPSQNESQTIKKESAPQAEAKPVFKSWANLAANGRDKWASKVADVRATASPQKSPQPQQQQAQPAQPQPQQPQQQQPIQQKQQPQQQPSQPQRNPRQDIPLTRSNGYKQDENLSVFVKGVQDGMTPEMFKESFGSVGPVKAVDVIIPKNCAFVEFTTVEAYKSAITQSTFAINGQNVYAEERRKSFRQPGRSNYNQGERRGGYHQNGERGGRRGRGGRPFNKAPADKISK